MFHSAGYFRGVLCPFFEHGLCHRPHCHYKHSKPSSAPSKVVNRVPPKLKTKLHTPKEGSRTEQNVECVPVTPQVNPGTSPKCSSGESQLKAQADGKGTKNVSPRKSGLANTASVTGVVEAVDTIANYFGTSSPGRSDCLKPEQAGGTSGGINTTICSADVVTDKKATTLPGASEGAPKTISRTIANEKVGDTKAKNLEEKAMPSYAPEKCINYSKVSESASVKQRSDVGDVSAAIAVIEDVSKLKDALVTKRDIFGSQPEKVEDDDRPQSSGSSSSIVEVPTGLDKESLESDRRNASGHQDTKESDVLDEAIFKETSAELNDILNIDEGESDDCVIICEDSSNNDVGRGSTRSPADSDSPIDCGENEYGMYLSGSEDSNGSGDGVEQQCSPSSMAMNALEEQGKQPLEEMQYDALLRLGDEEPWLEPSSDPKEEYSKEDQKIMEQFQKIAAMEVEPNDDVNSQKRKMPASEETNLPEKKRRIAYPQAKKIGEREPTRVSKAKQKDTNFSSMLKQTDLYMGKKRIANKTVEGTSLAIKRPKLPLVVNAKIPTKVRQKYLDAFIDEHMKMECPPEKAYEKALRQEKTVFDQCNGRNVYLNKIYGALKILKQDSEKYTKEKREQSDERVRNLKQAQLNQKKKVSSSDDTKWAFLSKPSMTGNKSSESVLIKGTYSSLQKRSVSSTSSSDNDFLPSKECFASTATRSKEKSNKPKDCSPSGVYNKQSATSECQSLIPRGKEETLNSELHKNKSSSKLGMIKKGKQKQKSIDSEQKQKSIDDSDAIVSSNLDFILLEETITDDLKKESKLGVANFYGKSSVEACNKVRHTSSEGHKISAKAKPSVQLSHNWMEINSTSENTVRIKRHKNCQTSVMGKSMVSSNSGDELLKHATPSDDVSCTTVLPGNNSAVEQKRKPDLSILKKAHRIGKLKDLKYVKPSLSPNSTTKIEGKDFSFSSLKKSCNKPLSSTNLESELFGSDDEASADDCSRILSHSKRLSKKRRLDSSSEEVCSNDECFIVDSSSKSQSRSESRDKSPLWSSDDDDWSTMKASFESALSSADVVCKGASSSSLKKRKVSCFKESKVSREKMSMQSVLSKVPSVKLCRNAGVSSGLVAHCSPDVNKSPLADGSSAKDGTVKIKTNFSGRTKMASSQNDWLRPNEDVFLNDTSAFVQDLVPKYSKNGDKMSIKKDDTKTNVKLTQKRRPSSSIGEECFAKSNEFIKLKKPVVQDKSKRKHKILEIKGKLKESGTKSNHESQVAAVKPKVGIVKKKEPPPLTSKLLFSMMSSYVLTDQQLHDCGYPRLSGKDGVAAIFYGDNPPSRVVVDGPNCKIHECSRCHNTFSIYNNGHYKTIESCSYHYGRPFKVKDYGEGMVSRYSCCQERSGAPGCQIAKLHVTSGEYLSEMPGYVTTSYTGEGSKCVYALDCEMCYTTEGLELTRVSVVDMSLKPVYENIVKPCHTIVDYNTRFSGLTAKDFANVTKTLSDVQKDLLKMFSSETILLGHSLESDLRALKIIHSQVVDTAIVFPHRMGLPYKRALKTLTKEILHKFIQNDVDEGHDSLEDSRACMELMLWKINGDRKSLCRRTISV